MNRRHLRILLLDSSARQLREPRLSSAIMPGCQVGPAGRRSDYYTGMGGRARTDLAHAILRGYACRPESDVRAVVVICCPDVWISRFRHGGRANRSLLNAANGYSGTVCVLTQSDPDRIVSAPVCEPSLEEAIAFATGVARVLLRSGQAEQHGSARSNRSG